MLNIRQFRYSADNLAYLIHTDRIAVAVDPGAADDMLRFLSENRLDLKYVTNTHRHPDHTCGNDRILEKSGATFLDNRELVSAPFVELDPDDKIHILHTPGHTDDSITFQAGVALITGDTLFNGTVGNCFSGDLEGFYHSIKRLLAFPDNTVIYAGHDYVRDSMAAARSLEPDNPGIDAFMKSYDPGHVRSTLGQERSVNPYLRFNEPGMVERLRRKGADVETEYGRWSALMRLF